MLLHADYIFLYSPNFWEGINAIYQPDCVDYIALGKNHCAEYRRMWN
jgi:hypothetical protein